MDRIKLYEITYALAARDGREQALFGSCAPAALEAFSRSLAGEAFPELWFEVPLAGDPWFDLHALVSHKDVAGTHAAFSGQDGVYADALTWFCDQQQNTVRQLARSPFPLEFQFDVGAKGAALPNVSASVRFTPEDWTDPERCKRIGNLLREVQAMGLADNRLEQLARTVFAQRVTHVDESVRLTCFPAFVKLRWRAGEPACAKAYLMAKARDDDAVLR